MKFSRAIVEFSDLDLRICTSHTSRKHTFFSGRTATIVGAPSLPRRIQGLCSDCACWIQFAALLHKCLNRRAEPLHLLDHFGRATRHKEMPAAG